MKTKPVTTRQAADILQAIRNSVWCHLTKTDLDHYAASVDRVGESLAAAGGSKKVMQLLSESHRLREKIDYYLGCL